MTTLHQNDWDQGSTPQLQQNTNDFIPTLEICDFKVALRLGNPYRA